MTSSTLPVTILVPTRNSRRLLERHIDTLNEIARIAAEVVVIDSESTDGTVGFLKEHLRHPGTNYLEHPPGLYASWNAGIRAAGAEYVHIATSGDRAPAATLNALYETARASAADVTASPPVLINPPGKKSALGWPIHRYIRHLPARTKGHALDPAESLVWNLLFCPLTLIGSSASNLYRTSVLQRLPFPLDFGSKGDSAWAIRNAFALRWAVAPDAESEFVFHEREHAQEGDVERRYRLSLISEAEHTLDRAREEDLPRNLADALRDLLLLYRKKAKNDFARKDLRDQWFPHQIDPRFWMRSQARRPIRKSIAKKRREILALTHGVDGGVSR